MDGLTGNSALVEGKKPREHQLNAISKAHIHYMADGNDRGKLIMACGTGKTYTSLLIAEQLFGNNGLVLFMVPSIALLGQSLNAWSADAKKPIKAVCIFFNEELLTFADFNREHARCLAFLKEAVSSSNARKKIVVTHHVPSFQMQCPKFADSQANGSFTVELEDYIKDSGIDFWIYGHSHYNVDVRIGNTMCISNQLGYVFHGEHESFDPCKNIEV